LRSVLRLTFVSCGLLFASALPISAQFGVPLNQSDARLEPATVRELVARYCRLDYAGARLNPADWPKIQPLVAWRTNPEYPLFMVTSRFDVDADLTLAHGKYQVTVHYRLIGKYDVAEGYSQDPVNPIEDVRFTVSEVNGDWRITDAEPNYPHPSKPATVQWLSQKLAETQDPLSKTLYQNALGRLQSQTSAPSAK